ncbi:Phosphatidylinositol-4-phosphate 5-kinase [Gonapodya sp. JEL0774]|nr:Phosphatidylinositol-4-phosphate 5-kinase [Gonapodya sp. JEL0774]
MLCLRQMTWDASFLTSPPISPTAPSSPGLFPNLVASPTGVQAPVGSQIRLETVSLFLTSRRRTQKARAKLLRQKSLKKQRKPPGKETIMAEGTVGWYMLMGIKEGARRNAFDLPDPSMSGSAISSAPVPSQPNQPRPLAADDFASFNKYAIDDDPDLGEVVHEYEWKEDGQRKTSQGVGGDKGAQRERASYDAGVDSGMNGGVGVGGSGRPLPGSSQSSTGVSASSVVPEGPLSRGARQSSMSLSGAPVPAPINVVKQNPSTTGSGRKPVTGMVRSATGKNYDFKFKDYAPRVFADIRRRSGVTVEEYLSSLTTPSTSGQMRLWESGSAGKSGSFFFFTEDGKYIIKTIHHSEHKVFWMGLRNYYEHIIANPHSLINRLFGLHRVKLPRSKKVHFVVMENVLPLTRDIEEMYDLKGSTFGRETPQAVLEETPRSVQKDKNWQDNGRELYLNAEKREILMGQMTRDVRYLASAGIMDYSLLVGISRKQDRWGFIRRLCEEGHLREGAVPEEYPMDSRLLNTQIAMNSLFRSDFCDGYRSARSDSNVLPPYVYHLGIIDIFTRYDAFKSLEHALKSLYQSATTISAVNPRFYGRRFVEFMGREVCGGDPADVRRWIAAYEGKGKEVDVDGLVAEYLKAKKRRMLWVEKERETRRGAGSNASGRGGDKTKSVLPSSPNR